MAKLRNYSTCPPCFLIIVELYREDSLNLDIRTVGILSAITPLVLGLIMLVYHRERRVYQGFHRWLLANFGLGVGYILISFRDFIPEFLSIILGNVIIVYCAILVYEGIEQFFDRPPISLLNYFIFGLYIISQIYFTYIEPYINARVVLTSFVLCFLILRSAKKLYSCPISELRQTCQSAAYAFTITAIFPFIRGVTALFEQTPIRFFSDPLNSWLSLVLVVSIMIWTFYFFFLNSARLERELETARAELDLVSRTDPLTQLYNRRHFDEQANLEFQRAIRYKYPLAFIVLDLDNLKTINDNYGHAIGDSVLSNLSENLRSQIRPFDLLARLGGDEFSIMLVDTNQEEAYSTAKRICEWISRTPVVYDSYSIQISVSIGVTMVRPEDNDLDRILERTDSALYRAKKQGRNCVVIA